MALFSSTASVPWESRPPAFEALAAPLPEDLPAEARRLMEGVEAGTLGGWLEKLDRRRVAADRSTSPDLMGQLRLASQRRIDTVVCSCLDEEPSLRPNAAMAAQYPQTLSLGLEWLGRLCDARRMWVVFDGDAPARWTARARHATKRAGGRPITLTHDYPQSDPTLLLHRLMSRRLPPGHLPPEAGVLLLDAAAAVGVGQALAIGRIEQWPCAIRDHITGRSHYLAVAHGRAIGHVLQVAGLHPAAVWMWAGHPLRNVRLEGHARVCGHELAFHAAPRLPGAHPRGCIRCGWCLESCPMSIHPARILEAAQRQRPGQAVRQGLGACIECGLCTYICPSQLPLLEGIRRIKQSGDGA